MRFLTARLSAKRRSPMAGLVVLLLGLLLTGGAYAMLSPAQRRQSNTADQAMVGQGAPAVPRRLRLLPRPERRGHRHQARHAVRSPARGCRSGRGRLPGRHRPDADGAARASRRPSKKVVYSPDEISALAAYVASLGPGPAVPEKSEYDTADADSAAIARGGQFFRTNCTACHNFAAAGGALPRGKAAPSLHGVEREAHVRGDAHRTAADAGVLRRGPQAVGEARHHRLRQEPPGLAEVRRHHARVAWARSPKDWPPGSSASAPLSGSPCGSPRARSARRRGVNDVSDHSTEVVPRDQGDDGRPDRRPGPPPARAAAHRRRRARGAARRAPDRHAVRALQRLRDPVRASPTSRSRSARTPRSSSATAPPTSRSASPSGSPCSASASARSSGRAS